MKHLIVVVALLLAPSAAFAQVFGEDEPDPLAPPPPPDDPPVEPPLPPPRPEPAVVAPAVEAEPAPVEAARPLRPEGRSIAIGAGWRFPGDLQAPNVTSARLRLASGLTFEPRLELARASSRFEDPLGTESESATTTVTIETLVRKTLAMRGKVDFEVIGAAGISNRVVNPDGPDNDTTTRAVALAYGVAVGYWFSPHFYVTLTGLNPILSITSQTEDNGPGSTSESSTTGFGLVWDPDITAMAHLYF